MRHRYTGMLLALILVSAGSADAEVTFTNLSTGADWNLASSDQRLTYCTHYEELIAILCPGVTPETLRDAVSEFYASADEVDLKLSIRQLIANMMAPLPEGH